jgi:molybdenum cofactor cytidylyltransferase
MPLKPASGSGGGSDSHLGAILLAAGGSTRLGRPKQLLEFDGEPLVVRQARLLVALRPACVVVVTGRRNEDVASLLGDLPVRCEHNPEWQRGMGTSLACGIRAMPERARAALVLLVDQWKLALADLEILVETWASDPQAAVLAAYDGTRGPPAILPRALFERLSRLQGDSGARNILKRWKGTVKALPLARATVDVDTAADLPKHSGSA